jgi:predicted nuclease of predicted toxin-antitoxin system
VKLLLDENLSPRLVSRLRSLFAELTHVRAVGLREADDETVWKWAQSNGHVIVTTDADFVAMSQRSGWPPKVIHIEHCDYPSRVTEELLRTNGVRIAAFVRQDQSGLLILRRG